MRSADKEVCRPSPIVKNQYAKPKIVANVRCAGGRSESLRLRKEIAITEGNAREGWEELVRRAVGSNTFRAFRRMPERPSEVFRNWAREALVSRGYVEKLKTVRSRADYCVWLTALVSDFQKYWRAHMGTDIPYGPAYKLPNLLLKCVAVRPELPRDAGHPKTGQIRKVAPGGWFAGSRTHRSRGRTD